MQNSYFNYFCDIKLEVDLTLVKENELINFITDKPEFDTSDIQHIINCYPELLIKMLYRLHISTEERNKFFITLMQNPKFTVAFYNYANYATDFDKDIDERALNNFRLLLSIDIPFLEFLYQDENIENMNTDKLTSLFMSIPLDKNFDNVGKVDHNYIVNYFEIYARNGGNRKKLSKIVGNHFKEVLTDIFDEIPIRKKSARN